MAYIQTRRPRGLNFLLGGIAVCAALVAYVGLGGSLDIGISAPEVRIDQPLFPPASAATR